MFKYRTKRDTLDKTGGRSRIARHARQAMIDARTPRVCCICGYNLHVEVAHRKAVADFPDDAEIGEINCTTNLIYLCPNHHWEYDHGHIEL